MLKKIPHIISPELMKLMMEMGHSDVMIFADANFPAASYSKRLLRAEGTEISELLKAIIAYYPLDYFIPNPVTLMNPLSTESRPQIWEEYESILKSSEENKSFSGFNYLDRLEFYEKSKSAYVIVQTGTTARYANIMLQKGVV